MAVTVSDSSGQPLLAPTYAGQAHMGRAVFGLKHSAGGGLVQFGERPQQDGSSLAGFAVELPAGHWRVLVFRGRGGGYTLADDFVASASGIDEEVAGVRQAGDDLVYVNYSGKELLARPIDSAGRA